MFRSVLFKNHLPRVLRPLATRDHRGRVARWLKGFLGGRPLPALAAFARDTVSFVGPDFVGDDPAARQVVYLLDAYELVVSQATGRLVGRKGIVGGRRFFGEGYRRVRVAAGPVYPELPPGVGLVEVSPLPPLVLMVPDDLAPNHPQVLPVAQ